MSAAVDKAAALARFALMRDLVHRVAEDAAKMPGLPDHLRAQAVALARLSGMRLHQVYGQAGPADANAIRSDLEDIARSVVDPLILAIGQEAKANLPHIEIEEFQDVMIGGLDGFALYDLDKAANELREIAREIAADPRGWAKAQREGVD